ncbi:MAG: DUF4239 domain-containing protein [Polyangiales bacterium]
MQTPSPSRRWPSTLAALTPPVAGAMALSVAGLALFGRVVPPAVLRPSGDAVGNYLQTVGSIYAVLLAFVVFVVWQQFNDARAAVEREAAEAQDLARLTAGICEGDGDRLLTRLRRYLDAVVAREWTAMARNDERTLDEVSRHLDEVWQSLRAMQPRGDRELALYGEALARFNDLADARAMRLTASRTRIPTAMRILLYAGALILVASMYLLALDDFAVHATITAAMAGAVSHILYLVEDLDDAFDGDWQVSADPRRRASSYLATARMCPSADAPADT